MSSLVSSIDLDELPEFRPFPAVATRVMAACDDPNIEASQIAEIVQCDPMMAVRMLSVANSSMYGFSSAIATIEQAIVVVGFRAAKSLVLAIAASAVFEGGSKAKQAKSELWQHSLACAAVARLVAKQVGVCTEEAFLAAVVHDVGKLVFFEIDDEAYRSVTDNVCSSNVLAVESESFGITHAELGERYGGEWGLPCEIIDAIACHHEPDSAVSDGKLAGVICIANSIAISLRLGRNNVVDEDVDAAIGRSPFTLDQQTIQHISENAAMEYDAVRKTCA